MKLFLLKQSCVGESDIRLTGKDYHYLTQVRRHKPGDVIDARDSDGLQLKLELLTIDKLAATVDFRVVNSGERAAESRTDSHNESNAGEWNSAHIPQIVLVQSLPKGKKTDQIIRQAVESGVRAIIIVPARHSVPVMSSQDFEKKRQRWQLIIEEAVQQSANPYVPDLLYFSDYAAFATAYGDGSLPEKGLGWFDSAAPNRGLFLHQLPMGSDSLHSLLAPVCSNALAAVFIAVGPEGGFSDDECAILQKSSFHAVFLGDTILRTETAGVFALGAVKTILREERSWKIHE